MRQADQPIKINIPWAASAGPTTVHEVPDASQQQVTDGAASWTDGFPPLTLIAKASGGKPPAGQDFNGALKRISAWVRYLIAAGVVPYDPAFQSAVGGYPYGAAVCTGTAAVPGRIWVSTVDGNLTNPDTGGAGWLPLMLPADVLALIAANGGIIRLIDANNSSTGDAIVGAPQPAITAYVPGQVFELTAPTANTKTQPTATAYLPNGTPIGSLTIVGQSGATLAPGDLQTGLTFLAAVTSAGTLKVLSKVASDIVALMQRPVTTYTGTVNGGGFYAMDLGSQQVFNLPNPSGLASGWYADLLVTGSPSGAQTAYAQIASGSGTTNLTYRGLPHAPFYLIGGGEILRFIWTSVYFLVEVLGQPNTNNLSINQTNIGGASSQGGTGGYQYVPINSTTGTTAVISMSSTVIAMTVPVSGTYYMNAQTAFLSSDGTNRTGTLAITDANPPTVVYANTNANATNSAPGYPVAISTTFLKQGSGVNVLVNCPSGLNFQPVADTFSLKLINR